MKSKTVLSCGAVIFLNILTPALASAQRAGFQAGIAQPQSTFTATPVPFPQVIGPSPLVPAIPLVPNFPTVIIPNQVLVPGQTAFPSPFFNSAPVQPFPPAPVYAPVHRPFTGMPRAEVLRQFGQPSVTVITSTGETLYFPGNVTVIIQNGRVAGPR